MKRLTDRELEKVRRLIENPPPGSKIAAAKQFGVDLTLLTENLRLTPQERIDKLQDAVVFLEEIKKQDNFAAENLVNSFALILQPLAENKADFITVGELACFIHGWRHIFLKLEILYSPTTENLKKIVAALANFKPRLRGFPNNFPFVWDEKVLQDETNLLIETSACSIDLLSEISGIVSYGDSFANSITIKFSGGDVRVLSLDDLIKAKKAAARPKDLFVLPQLETLREAANEK